MLSVLVEHEIANIANNSIECLINPVLFLGYMEGSVPIIKTPNQFTSQTVLRRWVCIFFIKGFLVTLITEW